MARLVNLSWIKIPSVANVFPPAPMRGIVKRTALLLLMLAGIQTALADSYFAAGTGTASDPFQISSVTELQAFGSMCKSNHSAWTSTYQSAHYKLMNNITLTGNSNNYNPAGVKGDNGLGENFSGTFDGNNKTISNLKVDINDSPSVGLVGCLSGTIKNLTISSSTLKSTISNVRAGAFAGRLETNGTIQNCTAIDCTVSALSSNTYSVSAGGIVGQIVSSNTSITGCLTKGNTTININSSSSSKAGAIVGEHGSSISPTLTNNIYEWTVKKNDKTVEYDKGWGIGGKNDVAGQYQIQEVNSWTILKNALLAGGNIKLAANCTDSEKSTSSYLYVPGDKTVILDLNGKTIDRGLKNQNAISYGMVIHNQGTLTINDNSSAKNGKITGGNNSNSFGGGGIRSDGEGALTINGGYIDDNKAESGGGIDILSGSLTINGGTISNNTAEIGGGICQNSSNIEITITGGTITGNKGTKTDPYANGGGMYCMPSKLNIKGYITITGNTVADKDCNICINGSSKVYVTGNLDSRTKIGIYGDRNLTYFDVTNGLGNKGNKSNFISDNSKFAVGLENGEIRLKSVITPSVNMSGWTYTGESYSPSVSVKVGSNTIYSGYGTVTYTYKASTATNFTSTAPVDAGTHQVKASIAESSQYSSGEATSSYTISKRSITIKANNQEITYGGSINSATDMVSRPNSTLATGESLTAITLTPSTSDCTTNGTITPSAATIKRGNTDKTSNYNITYQTGKLTISKKNITIRAKEQIITYGSNISSSTAQVTFTELVTNDALTSITLTPSTSNCTTNGTISTSAATIKRGNTDKTSNYNITYASGNLIINKKALTVTAKNHTITYGDTPANNGVSYSGFVNSETSAVLGGTLAYAYSYSQFDNVGNTYTITPSGLMADNYAITFVPGTLTVAPKGVVVTGITASNKVYDGNTTATINSSATFTGKLENDELTLTATGVFNDKNVGTGKDVTVSDHALGGTSAGNYTIISTGTQTSTTANITPKTVGITWGPTILTYNNTPQAPTATATELVAGDDCNVTVTGQQTAVGVYSGDNVAIANVLDNSNYQLPYPKPTTAFEIANPLSMSFAAGQLWATWYGAYNYEVPTGMTAYKVSSVNGTTVTVDAIDYVPANTGVLINRTATDAADVNSNIYNGETSAITSLLVNGNPTPYTDYILFNNQFVLSSVSTIGDHRCYLPGSGVAGTRGLLIVVGGDDTTSIEQKLIDVIETGEWYDIQGRRIVRPHKKGIYIRDGKKVVIK